MVARHVENVEASLSILRQGVPQYLDKTLSPVFHQYLRTQQCRHRIDRGRLFLGLFNDVGYGPSLGIKRTGGNLIARAHENAKKWVFQA